MENNKVHQILFKPRQYERQTVPVYIRASTTQYTASTTQITASLAE